MTLSSCPVQIFILKTFLCSFFFLPLAPDQTCKRSTPPLPPFRKRVVKSPTRQTLLLGPPIVSRIMTFPSVAFLAKSFCPCPDLVSTASVVKAGCRRTCVLSEFRVDDKKRLPPAFLASLASLLGRVLSFYSISSEEQTPPVVGHSISFLPLFFIATYTKLSACDASRFPSPPFHRGLRPVRF